MWAYLTKPSRPTGGTELSWHRPVVLLHVLRVDPATENTSLLSELQPQDDNETREVSPLSRS